MGERPQIELFEARLRRISSGTPFSSVPPALLFVYAKLTFAGLHPKPCTSRRLAGT